MLQAITSVVVSAAVQAIMDDYYFQFFYDDLPVWGYVGKMEKVKSRFRQQVASHVARHCVLASLETVFKSKTPLVKTGLLCLRRKQHSRL